jgi:hypothetical protein
MKPSHQGGDKGPFGAGRTYRPRAMRMWVYVLNTNQIGFKKKFPPFFQPVVKIPAQVRFFI